MQAHTNSPTKTNRLAIFLQGARNKKIAAKDVYLMPQILEEKTFELDAKETYTQNFGEPIDYTKEYSDEYYENYILNFKQNTKKRYFFRFVKRAFDIVAAFFALVLVSPILLITAIAIKIDSKGPIIFKQQRMGKDGKPFNCLKFRSMKIDTPKNVATSLLTHPEDHYTKVGRFIRKLSIDELPQFWCVLIGKMSFIGYRPLVLSEENCNEMRARLGVFAMRPGISGYAQVHGRDDVYYKNKAILDATYVKKASLWLDIKLIFQTVWVVFSRIGNDAAKIGKIENKTEVTK